MDVQQKINAGLYKNPLPYGPGKAGRDAYMKLEAERIQQFWQDVAEEFDSSQYKAAQWNKLCAKAWEHGHSSGLSEVFYWVSDLIGILDAKG